VGTGRPDPQQDASGPPGPERLEETLRLLSHQLKAPLNAIQSLLNTVAEGFAGAVDPKALRLVSRAASRADEASELVSDLLDFQYYAGGGELRRSEFDFVDLVAALCARHSSVAGEKDVSLLAELPTGLRLICDGDRRAVGQALRNVIENAVRYTPSGGHVRVTLRPPSAAPVCELRVSDTGPGIPAEEQERIFEPFYRATRVRSTMPGTGLGLPIARSVVERHGGTITVESREGAGSTFTLVLPLKRVDHDPDSGRARRRVVIVGGVTAGPKAAARLRRLDEEAEITIIEKGELLSYTGSGLPHYISGKVSSPRALMSNADDSVHSVRFFESIKNVRTLSSTLAVRVDRKGRRVQCRDLRSETLFEVPYDTLILATGATPSIPPIPGIDQRGIYTLHSLEDAEAIKRELGATGARDVAIIGAGLIGVSLAESLIDAGARVTIIEQRQAILASYFDPDVAQQIQASLRRRAVGVVVGATITEIRREGSRLTIVKDDGALGVDLVILATGVHPNTGLARECGLELGQAGGIKVNKRLQTSDERIFAVGDCAESVNLITGRHEHWPLGSISTKMGRIAADAIAGRKAEFHGSVGTGMFRIFDLNAARTGLTLETASERGFDVESVVITGLDRAHYSDKAEYVSLKVIADRKTGVLLGAQGFGRGDIVAKIEILACAITQRLTVGDVFRLDLGYHPAFNTPIDITQAACLVLENKMEGRLRTVCAAELEAAGESVTLVDVSPAPVYSDHSIPGSINAPIESIRREELPFDAATPVVLYSNTSAEAYEAYLLLRSRGYSNLRVLEGGYRYWAP